MSEFVRICSASELPVKGRLAEFVIGTRPLCVANLNGAIAVLDGLCPHEGGPLADGIVENGKVVCPWHGYSFDVHTGLTENDPDLKVGVLEAKVEDGELRVKL